MDDFYYPTVQKFLVVVLAQIPITILTYYIPLQGLRLGHLPQDRRRPVADKDDWEWPVTIAAVSAAFVFLSSCM
ncbi:hypothetical protein V8E36_002902 [Tilletia maclaganii]